MIRLICPECHSRCQLKNTQSNHTFSYGRCPACGYRFLLPLVKEQPESINTDPPQSRPDKQEHPVKTWLKLIKTKIPHLIRNPLFISLAGLNLVLLILVISLNVNRQAPTRVDIAKQEQLRATTLKIKTAPAPELQPAEPETKKLQLDPAIKARAIARIKHRALVEDADISIHDRHIQLALLVSEKAPKSYAERLGYQFAHYIRELIGKDQPPPLFQTSVYYPDGRRIEVITKDHFMEEEVILKMEDNE